MQPPQLPKAESDVLDRLQWWSLLVMSAACASLSWGSMWAIEHNPNNNVMITSVAGLLVLLSFPAAIYLGLRSVGHLILAVLDLVPDRTWGRIGLFIGKAIIAIVVMGFFAAVALLLFPLIDRKLLIVVGIAALAYIVIRSAVAAGIRDGQNRWD